MQYLTSHVCFKLQEKTGRLRQAVGWQNAGRSLILWGNAGKGSGNAGGRHRKGRYQELERLLAGSPSGGSRRKRMTLWIRHPGQASSSVMSEKADRELKGDFLLRSPAKQALRRMQEASGPVRTLLSLAIQFLQRVLRRKRDRTI